MATDHTVRIGRKNCRTTVYLESESVWVATGEYQRKTVEVKGTSEAAAIALWIQAARKLSTCESISSCTR